MWPWTHVAFGYVWYSVAVHLLLRRRPTDVPAILAGVSALLPDLVDKPLAWSIGATGTGYGPAHSLFVGIPIVALVAVGLWRWARLELGIALFVGYASHLLGDIIFQYFDDGRIVTAVVTWPFGPAASESTGGILDHVVHYLRYYVHAIVTGEATTYVVMTIGIVVGVFALWIADGTPGLALVTSREFRRQIFD